MFLKILQIFTSMFCKDNLGKLLKILILRASSIAAKEILDKQNQEVAYNLLGG